MAATQRDSRNPVEVIESLSPATGEILGTVPAQTDEQVAAAVWRARAAAETWQAMSARERRFELTAWRRALALRLDELVELIHLENGKPRADAISEVLTSLSHLAHATNRAERLLRPRRVGSGLLANFRSSVSYEPLGVVGVIGPWNYPVFTPMGSISCALAAGNAVVFKPSELTPLVGQLLGEIAAQTFSVSDLFQVVTGDGRTGAALARADIDKLAFTGSADTGRKVMTAAAERLTPILLELGGKDAAIVAEDADLDEAAQAVTFGAFTNAGQACTSIERCYVAGPVYQRFIEKVVARASEIRWGGRADAEIGPITRPQQVDIIRAHIEDAVARGATVLCGGLDGIRGQFVPPTVLTDVTDDMRVMKEETFGPVLPIVRVNSMEEAVELTNASPYGLGSAVFGGAKARGVVARLRTGASAVNSVLAFGAIPSLPFGGVGESGFGRIHGDEGLLEFVRTKSIAEKRVSLPVNPLSFGASEEQLRTLVTQLFGGGAVDRAGDVLRRLKP